MHPEHHLELNVLLLQSTALLMSSLPKAAITAKKADWFYTTIPTPGHSLQISFTWTLQQVGNTQQSFHLQVATIGVYTYLGQLALF